MASEASVGIGGGARRRGTSKLAAWQSSGGLLQQAAGYVLHADTAAQGGACCTSWAERFACVPHQLG